tara:strand:- start:765 stop:1388 length:624 start_codon:yes stop_codon:yes gene_type:complete
MKEFKNFLPTSLANELHDKVTSNEFPWYWLDDVTANPEERKEVKDRLPSQPGMHHTPYCENSGPSHFFGDFQFIYHYIIEAMDLDWREWYLSRLRVGLNFPSFRKEHILHNQPHVDFPESETVDHFTCLYYINDSDGPTVVFNEKEKSKLYTVKYQCHPEKNKLFVFDGKHYHASSCPKHHDARLAITVNIIQRRQKGSVKPFLRVA